MHERMHYLFLVGQHVNMLELSDGRCHLRDAAPVW